MKNVQAYAAIFLSNAAVFSIIGALVFHEPTVKTDLCLKGYPEYDEFLKDIRSMTNND